MAGVVTTTKFMGSDRRHAIDRFRRILVLYILRRGNADYSGCDVIIVEFFELRSSAGELGGNGKGTLKNSQCAYFHIPKTRLKTPLVAL